VPDADWIKVLDAPLLLAEVLRLQPPRLAPNGAVCLDTDAGHASIECRDGAITVTVGLLVGAPVVSWPAQALAQLVTGYQSAATLAALHGPAALESLALLGALFPRRWRLSRNESWTYEP
jgi:hypothetical protein